MSSAAVHSVQGSCCTEAHPSPSHESSGGSPGLWLSPAKWRSPRLLLCWKIGTLMVVEQGHLVDARWALVVASLWLLHFSCGKDIICSHRLKCWMPCLEMPSGALTFSDAPPLALPGLSTTGAHFPIRPPRICPTSPPSSNSLAFLLLNHFPRAFLQLQKLL